MMLYGSDADSDAVAGGNPGLASDGATHVAKCQQVDAIVAKSKRPVSSDVREVAKCSLGAVSECSLGVNRKTCPNSSMIVQIDRALGLGIKPTSQQDNDRVMEAAKQKTECKTQMCVLQNRRVESSVNPDDLQRAKEIDIKPVGHANTTNLLNNSHIDNVLRNLTSQPQYKNCYHMGYQMIDFNGSKTQAPSELATIDICQDVILKGYTSMCVVLNTDTRDGKGLHWFCLFCDFRTGGSHDDLYTIEYFNSSGNTAMPSVLDWQEKTTERIATFDWPTGRKKRYCACLKVSDIQHQKSETECGPYSLYYIWCRLRGTHYKAFNKTRITDDKMIEFRKHLFRPS